MVEDADKGAIAITFPGVTILCNAQQVILKVDILIPTYTCVNVVYATMHRRGRMCALRFLPASLFIRMASWHGQTFLGILMMHLAVIIFIMCPSNLLRSFAQSWDCSPYFSLLFGEERDERKVRVLHAQAFSILLNDVPHDLFWWVVEQNKKKPIWFCRRDFFFVLPLISPVQRRNMNTSGPPRRQETSRNGKIESNKKTQKF